MDEAIRELVEAAVESPWVYPALFAFAAVDAFFPMVPSETLVITAGEPASARCGGRGRARGAARRSTGPRRSSPAAAA